MMRNSVMMLFTQAALGAATFCYAQQPIPANVPSAVKAKMEQLSSPDPIKRAKAACALGAMEARAVAAIPRLVALLSDGTPIPTQNGCGNAEPFEDESWEPDIAEIHEPSPGEAATHALMAIGEPGVQALQRALLANEFWRARKNAAWGLAHRGDAIDELIAALKDEAWQVRTQAAYALFQRGGDEDRVINALITASRDEVKQVRTQAMSSRRSLPRSKMSRRKCGWPPPAGYGIVPGAATLRRFLPRSKIRMPESERASPIRSAIAPAMKRCSC
jgi:hypothetical protein